jgi:hypothetical protein
MWGTRGSPKDDGDHSPIVDCGRETQDPGSKNRNPGHPAEGYSGRSVWHCHILEHEDNEMMRPYDVLPK